MTNRSGHMPTNAKHMFSYLGYLDKAVCKMGACVKYNGNTWMVMKFDTLAFKNVHRLKNLIVSRAFEKKNVCPICKCCIFLGYSRLKNYWDERQHNLLRLHMGRSMSGVSIDERNTEEVIRETVALTSVKKVVKQLNSKFFHDHVRIFHRKCIQRFGGSFTFKKSERTYSEDVIDKSLCLELYRLDGVGPEKITILADEIRVGKNQYLRQGLRWSTPDLVRLSRKHILAKLNRKRTRGKKTGHQSFLSDLQHFKKLDRKITNRMSKKHIKRRNLHDDWLASCLRNVLIDAWIHPAVVVQYNDSNLSSHLIQGVVSMNLNVFVRVLLFV